MFMLGNSGLMIILIIFLIWVWINQFGNQSGPKTNGMEQFQHLCVEKMVQNLHWLTYFDGLNLTFSGFKYWMSTDFKMAAFEGSHAQNVALMNDVRI